MTISEKLTQIAENEPKVFEAGYEKGKAEGKQAEYDAFWDAYQDNGNRTAYPRAFGTGWNKTTFQPKYDLKPTNATWMFRDFNAGRPIMDLTEVGVNIDFSQVEGELEYLFYGANVSKIGVVDASKSTSLNYAFAIAYQLHTIIKLVVGQNTKLGSTFYKATSLENIVVEGVIAKSGLNLQWSTKLSKASIKSIINCLSTTTSGLSITLSKAAVDEAFKVLPGGIDGYEMVETTVNGSSSQEWAELRSTKSNWTINLV